jgi:hypothetical protein
MVEMLTMPAKEGAPAAPLFVTALSKDGKWHELLLERGHKAPEWLRTAVQIRIQAPSGETRDATFTGGKTDDAYDTCLSLLGPRRAWAPSIKRATASAAADLELWTLDEAPVSITAGPVLTLRRRSDAKASASGMTCYAVIRRKDRPAVWVFSNTGRFYLEQVSLTDGEQLVPRALLDLGLAGAFWGFTEHQNAPAATCAARRLLESVSQNISQERSPAQIAAAAHAVLAHRELLPDYGEKVLAILGQKSAPSPDAALLKALIGMALLSNRAHNKEAVKDDVRAAIKALAAQRAIFGETVRWLDAKFEVIRHLALRDLYDGTLKDELKAISDWLGTSFAGGQAAAYLGEAPLEGEGWHNALAEKKTLKS